MATPKRRTVWVRVLRYLGYAARLLVIALAAIGPAPPPPPPPPRPTIEARAEISDEDDAP